MPVKSNSRLIGKVLEFADQGRPGKSRDNARHFIRELYGTVAAEDLKAHSPEDWYGAAMDFLKFAKSRRKNQPKLRIQNPERKKNGWFSPHTVLELVNDDMPFLVDSLGMILSKHGFAIHLTMHPIMKVERNRRGNLERVFPNSDGGAGSHPESFQLMEIDRIRDPKLLGRVEKNILESLRDVRAAVSDWQKMRDKVKNICYDLTLSPPPIDHAEVYEGKAFLEWMADNNFTFLGYREYELNSRKGRDILYPVPRSGLGILKESIRAPKKEGVLLHKEALGGESIDSNVLLSESVLARVHFIVHTAPWKSLKVDISEIERKIVRAVRSWQDAFREVLVKEIGEEKGVGLARKFENAFSAAYREDISPEAAALDALKMEALKGGEDSIGMSLYRPRTAEWDRLRFKLFRWRNPIPMFKAFPILENMGLLVIGERPYEIELDDGRTYSMQEFEMAGAGNARIDPAKVEVIFKDAFLRIWRGECENDGFNKLVLLSRLTWRQTALLRSLCKYLLQSGVPFSQAYMEQTLHSNPSIARLLVEFFETRFDPEIRKEERREREERLNHAIAKKINGVASLDSDRILRGFLAVVKASLRTNYFQKDGKGGLKTCFSFKFDSREIPDLPLPRPWREIFVYSPRVEGIHLRGGRIARGGIRWSNRREDFRTEILGLMKAQTVKNAIIVPVGAKGGFVVKSSSGGRTGEGGRAEGKACYGDFIRGLLDLTDNQADGKIRPPRGVVRYDGDDPYLVVAADKGTAALSDIANEIAGEYEFWLGDAFASGGSVGYDHKKMGITARGAWEAVKRHFRDREIDIQKENFTVVGIGDMSGDVFGNGMLLSPSMKLLAAFNHRHIFLDPDPDPETSFRERERLFKLPRSTWDEYNRDCLSGGAAYFPGRRNKSRSARRSEKC